MGVLKEAYKTLQLKNELYRTAITVFMVTSLSKENMITK